MCVQGFADFDVLKPARGRSRFTLESLPSFCSTVSKKPEKGKDLLFKWWFNKWLMRYYKDDSCWSADLKSKTTEDIISNRSFMEVLVLNHYVLVKKVLIVNMEGLITTGSEGTSIYLKLLAGRRKECIKVGSIVSFNPELWLADSLFKITEKIFDEPKMWQRQRQKVRSDEKKDETVNFIKPLRADIIRALGTALICYVIAKDAAEDNEESKKSKSEAVEKSEQEYNDYEEEDGEYAEQGVNTKRKRIKSVYNNKKITLNLGEQEVSAGPVKCENVAADEKESIPSKPEFCIEAGSVRNVA
nr:hypothetical protein [Tanacetum cinerariifolium]